MTGIPKHVTICPDCKREDVGVVIDWTYRDGNDKLLGRYRMARHKIKFKAKDPSLPWCIGSRSMVPNELVFERDTHDKTS